MGVNYNNRVITDGLVLYLDAANPKSYPGSGTTWFDLSGYGNHGTMINNPTYSSENKGHFSFSGNNYFNVSLSSTVTQTSFTYNIWATSNNPEGGWRTLIDFPDDSWFLGLNRANHLTTYGPEYSSGYLISQSTIWVNMVVSHTNGSPLYFYINGNLVSTSVNDASSRSSSLYVIGAGNGGNETWNGKIATVQVYNRGLSSEEIKQNFYAHRSRFGI